MSDEVLQDALAQHAIQNAMAKHGINLRLIIPDWKGRPLRERKQIIRVMNAAAGEFGWRVRRLLRTSIEGRSICTFRLIDPSADVYFKGNRTTAERA